MSDNNRESALMNLASNERFDDTGFAGIKVIQTEEFGYGVDSVLLAAFAVGETGGRGISSSDKDLSIADLGTGNGIISFILAHKLLKRNVNKPADGDIKIVGIEADQIAYQAAMKANEINELTEVIRFLNLDIIDADRDEAKAIDNLDAIVTNPPYFKRGAAITSNTDRRTVARHETTATLRDFLSFSEKKLKQRGDFYMIHRPARLADIMFEMRKVGIEPKEIQMVRPQSSRVPNIVMIHGIKGAMSELSFLPDIIIHNEEGGYTNQINEIYER